MGLRRIFLGASRKLQLLVPITVMTAGAVVLLAALVFFLVKQFDATAVERERRVVESGVVQQIEQLDLVVVPQVDWDKAVAMIDHHMDLAFADAEFGRQLFTFNGVTHSFFVDGEGRVTYAYVLGQHEKPASFDPFRPLVAQLIGPIRRAEARRGRIARHAEGQGPITRPIQANGVIRIGDTVYLVMASLVQPDLGSIQPKGPRAPVAINAIPVGRAMLDGFATRYLLDDLRLDAPGQSTQGRAVVPLRAPDGRTVATLSWRPRLPSTALLQHMILPLIGGLILLTLGGVAIVRRSGVIVDELIASEMRAKHLAYHDPLTRLPNRTMMFEHLRALLATPAPQRPLLGLMCIDLDRFKAVNDTLGHQAGDRLLKAMASRLHTIAETERGVFAARLGGDEFVLLASAASREAIVATAQQCLTALLTPVDSEFGRLDIGCSIGVAVIDKSVGEASQALRQADMALYRAKAQGRGCITYYDPEMEAAFQSRLLLEAALRTAIDRGALRVVYQPQVNTAGKILGYESLVRWDHPELGAISPAVFIPLAEECGLILGIGEFVLRRVFAETATWRGVRVAINVSAIQMRTSGFAARLMQIAASAEIDPARYEIELTETALLTDTPVTTENYNAIKRMGFAVALDDFGTGNSSLSLLHRFRVDKIKIDRSFVADLGLSTEAETLVGAIVRLGRSFNLGVIAEGVETEAQKEMLVAAGCDEFQGYLTGRPVPVEVIEARMSGPKGARRRA